MKHVLQYKESCVISEISKKVVLYRGKNAAHKFIEEILKEYDYCKQNLKKAF